MNQKGFTLIELLVVIAIIGVLATMIITSIGDVQKRARDARRIQTVKQMQNALEMYYLDYGRYPSPPDIYYYAFTSQDAPCGHVHSNSPEGAWCRLELLLSPYMGGLPRASSSFSASEREYMYRLKDNSDPHRYALGVRLETANHPSAVNDGGYYNTRFEVGELTQCGLPWNGWNTGVPEC